MRTQDDINILTNAMHMCSDMSVCNQFQLDLIVGKLMFFDDPGASQCLFVFRLHSGPEGGIHIDSGQRSVARFIRSNLDTHVKNSTWQERCQEN